MICRRQFCARKGGMIMCNQEEKCRKMRNAALRVLTEHLKKAREAEEYSKCRKIITEIRDEISGYVCEPFSRIEEKISKYQNSQYYNQRKLLIDTLIAELETFLQD